MHCSFIFFIVLRIPVTRIFEGLQLLMIVHKAWQVAYHVPDKEYIYFQNLLSALHNNQVQLIQEKYRLKKLWIMNLM